MCRNRVRALCRHADRTKVSGFGLHAHRVRGSLEFSIGQRNCWAGVFIVSSVTSVSTHNQWTHGPGTTRQVQQAEKLQPV